MDNIDYTALQAALLDATKKTFLHIHTIAYDEHIYVFGLYSNGEMSYISPTANSEEGLLVTANKHLQKYGETISYWMHRLRWSSPDWKYHLEGESFFSDVKAILFKGWTEDFASFQGDRKKIEVICINTLQILQQQLKATTGQRHNILLNLFFGDRDIAKLLHQAEQLNSTNSYTRYKEDLESFL